MNGGPAGAAAGAFPSGGAGCDYDRFVDWDKRLTREGPFFRRLFGEKGVRSVADVGCGTGKHAMLFASWGLDVTGIDPAADMLAQARADALASGSPARFVEGGFGQVASLLPGPVDAVTCTGNALPHVDGHAGMRAALADFADALRPGGVLVLHLLNHERLLAGRLRSMPPVVRDTPEGTMVFLRVMEYPPGDEGIAFDFLTLSRAPGGEWDVASRRSVHTALPVGVLAPALEAAGFGDVRLYGDHAGKPFDPSSDESLLLTAARA